MSSSSPTAGFLTSQVDDKLLERAAAAGFLGKAFDAMVLVLDHVEAGIRHVCEVRVRTRVPAGSASGRVASQLRRRTSPSSCACGLRSASTSRSS